MISCTSTSQRKNVTRSDYNGSSNSEVQSCSSITCTEGNVLTLSEVVKKIVTTISQCSNSSTVVVINISSTIHTTSNSQVVTINIGNFKNFIINGDELTCKETSCICQCKDTIASGVCGSLVNSGCSCRNSECSNKLTCLNSTSSSTLSTTSNSQCVVSSVNTTSINGDKFCSRCLTSRNRRRSNSQDHTISKTCVSGNLNSSSTRSNVSDIDM